MTKSSRRNPHGRRQLTRIDLGNVLRLRTLDRGNAMMEILGARWHTTNPVSCPHGGGSLRPASNLVYDQMVFTGSHRRQSCVFIISV
jgi:hypothetical protein